MSEGALVVGGNLAAVQAALDLAESGISVTLVEETPFLGDGPPAQTLQTPLLLEAVKHPNVTLMTNTRVSAIHGRNGDLRVEVDRTPRYVDLNKCTACGDCVEVCPITIPVDGRPRKAIFGNGPGAVPDVFAIEKRGVSPCKATCPAGIHVQGYVALIAEGRFKEALELIREAVPFPGVLGRVCYHPCEDGCRRGTEVDQPVSICALKRFVADQVADHEIEHRGDAGAERVEVNPDLGKVAIVGAGPAGLTVADFLVQEGVACEVFEALPIAGGMLAVGIPDYRLPPDVLQREIAHIESLGVTIHLNHPVDQGGWRRLQEEYDAIFVGVGAHRARPLQIPGNDLEGVVSGVQFLREVNLAGIASQERPAVGEKVTVIGGGNTAIDSATVARRLGAKQVTILYRRSRQEMPANPWEIEEAEAEGVQFHFLASPVRAIGKRDRIVALECIRNELGEPDQSGRPRPAPVAGSEFTVPCDTLLLAIGQTASCTFEGLEAGRWDSIQVDPVTLQTNLAKVFAGGDAVAGPASVVDSVADGRRAAASILRYLRGEDLAQGRTARPPDTSGIEYYTPAEPLVRERAQMPCIPMSARQTFAEIALGLTEEQAVAEAQRCLACGVCSECLACIHACEPGAIDHDQVAERATLEAGAIIWSDAAGPAPPVAIGNLYPLHGDDPLAASAVAARAMADLADYRRKTPLPLLYPMIAETPRVGVFICRCGGQIGSVLDVDALVGEAGFLPDVIYAQDLSFGCQPEAAAAIKTAMANHDLDRVVLAGCSCCSLDQVCDSCTYQRVRCKTNLLDAPLDLRKLPVEFVNIREQCAWPHRDSPQLGTAKAGRLIAAAVAKAGLMGSTLGAPRAVAELDSRVLVAGDGEPAAVCAQALRAQDFAVTWSRDLPTALTGSLGRFSVTLGGRDVDSRGWEPCRDQPDWEPEPEVSASAVVLAPADEAQLARFTPQVGVFFCSPNGDAGQMGAAVAAKVGAILGGGRVLADRNVAQVDATRCRACGTCESVCEFLAIKVVEMRGLPAVDAHAWQRLPAARGREPSLEQRYWEPSLEQRDTGIRLVARVEPALCRGCGTCAAHCPSSAITAGYSTDAQIEAMLAALLAR